MQITANSTFLIEFDKEPSSKAHPVLQETAIYDIISYNDASRHSIAAGDKVLAPQGKLKFRFAPGTVLEGLEGRSSGCKFGRAMEYCKSFVNLNYFLPLFEEIIQFKQLLISLENIFLIRNHPLLKMLILTNKPV